MVGLLVYRVPLGAGKLTAVTLLTPDTFVTVIVAVAEVPPVGVLNVTVFDPALEQAPLVATVSAVSLVQLFSVAVPVAAVPPTGGAANVTVGAEV